ncbi:MAG TPA: TauD/TfdA family dioxygenase [Nevskiaceae bacterium]|nr:TauD/TfdA family dioxygenase [Nevskiaceae bacterium]
MLLHALPLTDRIGSEVRAEVDDLLTPPAAQDLRRLLVERGVLVFRGLHLSDAQQLELSRLMGALREEGDHGIYKVTLDQSANARAEYLKGSFLWHIDGTHDEVPVFASLLSARKLSATGGQTEFANSYQAYEALSPAMKARIAGLKVVHSVETSMRRAGIEATAQNVADWRRRPDTTHHLVWTHRSGRKSLVIGCHASHVAGMDVAEGQALLQSLLDWTTQPCFVYRHEWTPGDLLIWDNTGVLHRAEPYPLDSGRMMHRTTLLGEEAFA